MVRKDKKQCEKVMRMLESFESYPQAGVVADEAVKHCLQQFEVDVRGDVRAKKSIVSNILEPVNAVFEKLSEFKETQNAKPIIEVILSAVLSGTALTVFTILNHILSYISKNADFVATVIAYLLIATIGLGNVLVLIILCHKGLHSKVATKIRKKASKLEPNRNDDGDLLCVPFVKSTFV